MPLFAAELLILDVSDIDGNTGSVLVIDTQLMPDVLGKRKDDMNGRKMMLPQRIFFSITKRLPLAWIMPRNWAGLKKTRQRK